MRTLIPARGTHRFPLFAIAMALAVLCVAPAAFATAHATYFVGTSGNDTAAGSRAEPFATISRAVAMAAHGDTVRVLDGTYAGDGNRDIDLLGKAIVVMSDADDPARCIVDCADANGATHNGFRVTYGADMDSVVIRGFTIRGAGIAVAADEPAPNAVYGQYVKIERCVIIACAFGVNLGSRDLHLVGCSLTGNGNGVGIALARSAAVSGCTISGYMVGVQMAWDGWAPSHGPMLFNDCVISSNTLHGFRYFGESGATQLNRCRVEDNGSHGILARVHEAAPFTLVDCVIDDNGGDGFRSERTNWNNRFLRTSFCGNRGNGVSLAAMACKDSMDSCVVVGNGGAGVAVGNVYVTDHCDVTATLIADNGEAGLTIANGARLNVTSCTITDNGAGIVLNGNDLQLNKTILAANGGQAVSGTATSLAISCTDIIGHPGGDWVGALETWRDINGNRRVVPLFCDAASGDYHLAANSPLVNGINPCGQVGALGVGCPAAVSACRDLQSYDPATGACDTTYQNVVFTVEGAVYVAPGTYGPGSGGYLSDADGGINFWRDAMPADLQVGDRIRLTGRLWPWIGEFYLGDFTCVKLAAGPAPAPQPVAVADMVADHRLTGAHVSVPGIVADLTATSFRLTDGTASIEVRRNTYGGVSFAGLHNGDRVTVDSPCFMEQGTHYLKPAHTSDVRSDITWCATVGPAEVTVAVGVASLPIVGRVRVDGATPAPGALAGMAAELGWGPVGSDPAASSWHWIAAGYARDVDGADEFTASLVLDLSGRYDIAYRFAWLGGPWRYGDLDGSDNGYAPSSAGHVTASSASAVDGATPGALTLRQNCPNPFNPATMIAFDLPASAAVTLEVFDMSGHRVASLLDAVVGAGHHEVAWRGEDAGGQAVASGLYIARLRAGGEVRQVRMMVLR